MKRRSFLKGSLLVIGGMLLGSNTDNNMYKDMLSGKYGKYTIEQKLKYRKVFKKLAFKANVNGDMSEFTRYTRAQIAIKYNVNEMYGSYDMSGIKRTDFNCLLAKSKIKRSVYGV